jgi:L-amino acid N-acyltransferase YncA
METVLSGPPDAEAQEGTGDGCVLRRSLPEAAGVAHTGPPSRWLRRHESTGPDRRRRVRNAAEDREPALGDASERAPAGLDLSVHGSYTTFLMSATQPSAPELRRTVQLRDGSSVSLRLMTHADAAAIAGFARSLPEDDLLFLRMDITDPEAVAHWMKNLETGLATTVIAEAGGAIAGYATLVQNRVGWQRHLGEIRTQVGLAFRSRGLGRVLAGEIFALARARGLRKIVAQMTPDQKGAVATFERLGFRPEALLQDFVVDHAGRTRDLVVMAYDVTGLTDQVD